jgi:hypothetical protein
MTEYEKRKQWFLDRVGKVVYRDGNGCSCSVCERVKDKGVTIVDNMHALYLLDMEGMSNIPEESNHPFKYRDKL